ncbi:electron transport complex, RnfABCDGE type, A subunit [Mageeibacillus indolicus UPII9-5]|uniref:Ion-translocating oxidoreductase complex subunit A n=2 Tax=Mageeibacillus indolicus TaxID=884684 RepID=D3QZA6_MAGIU|nr:RnfABCDGE type electron transport complex subunit A [Mageeibacillus indolicus]ADC91667.1 electron transport complex, RnfABCDGE type, A subunit [Mageeibacillus indolicus UPII9-5]PNH18313.1 electron transport complex protein RnfA [Mageeibacillus indolicus]
MSTSLLFILFTAILTKNFVLAQFLGICPFLGVSKKLETAMGMSVAVIFVMVLATAVTFPINQYILEQFHMTYLQTLVFILVIAALVQVVEIVLKKFMPPLYQALGIYLPLITTNCAVLGVVLLNLKESYGYVQSLVNSFGAGVGFMLALFIFAGVRRHLETTNPPKFLQGLPIVLISASFVSMAFLGFAGIIDNIFK